MHGVHDNTNDATLKGINKSVLELFKRQKLLFQQLTNGESTCKHNEFWVENLRSAQLNYKLNTSMCIVVQSRPQHSRLSETVIFSSSSFYALQVYYHVYKYSTKKISCNLLNWRTFSYVSSILTDISIL